MKDLEILGNRQSTCRYKKLFWVHMYLSAVSYLVLYLYSFYIPHATMIFLKEFLMEYLLETQFDIFSYLFLQEFHDLYCGLFCVFFSLVIIAVVGLAHQKVLEQHSISICSLDDL